MDTVFGGYPANPKAGYRISGKGRIPDIRSDTLLGNRISKKAGLSLVPVFVINR
jgi:hypothetical protein